MIRRYRQADEFMGMKTIDEAAWVDYYNACMCKNWVVAEKGVVTKGAGVSLY